MPDKPQRELLIKRGKVVVPVSVIEAHEDLEHLAVGLYDGSVLLYRGLINAFHRC